MMAEPENGSADIASEQGSSLRAVAMLIAVVVGLTGVLWLLGRTNNSGDTNNLDDESDRAESGANNGGADNEVSGTANSGDASSSSQGSSEATTSGDAGSIGVTDSQRRFSSLKASLAYLSGDGVVVVNLETGTVTRVPIELFTATRPLDEYLLLGDGGRTVALSLGSEQGDESVTAVLVASTAMVVPSVTPLVDYWVVERARSPSNSSLLVGWDLGGYSAGGVRRPAGSTVTVTAEPGLLVIPPTGKTFRPTLHGFELVSEHRVLNSAANVRVEQRCNEQLICEVVAVDTDSGMVTTLPAEFTSELAEVSVSADGRWVLNDTSPAWLYDRQSGKARLLEVGGYGQAQWVEWPQISEDDEVEWPQISEDDEVESPQISEDDDVVSDETLAPGVVGEDTAIAWITADRTPALVLVRAEELLRLQSDTDDSGDDTANRDAQDSAVQDPAAQDSDVQDSADSAVTRAIENSNDDGLLIVELAELDADPAPGTSFVLLTPPGS